MSNQENPSSKVISIKKLSDIHPQHLDETGSTKSKQQASSSLEINRLQQQITDLNNQKENILAELRATIEKEKKDWAEEQENERTQAQEQGYQEGYEKGVKEAQAAWQEELNKVNELSDLAKEDYFRTVEKHEEAIIQLAITSAEKIVHRELERVDQTAFKAIVQEAIEELKDYAYIHIYVHPNEYEHVVNLKAELQQVTGAKDIISIYTDPELETYSCVIKHPNGQIDASVDLQLKQIKNALAEKVIESS